MTLNRYRASILLGAFGDTLGYHNGHWEFCYNTKQIRKEFIEEGGSTQINLKNLIVSDDTVLHLATIRALIKSHSESKEKALNIAKEEFVHSYYFDMIGRAPGTTTGKSMALLKKGLVPDFNLAHKTCGGAMRASAIGFRYHKSEDYEHLLWASIEFCRLTHNGPNAYMGSFLNALFTAYAINQIPANQWILKAIETQDSVLQYIKKLPEGEKHIEYINWIYEFLIVYYEFRYPDEVTINNKVYNKDPTYPYFTESYEYNSHHMDEIYDSLSIEQDGSKSWAGSCGISSVLIAYDALIHSIYYNQYYNENINDEIYQKQDMVDIKFYENAWHIVIQAGILHAGDNDSTGIIVCGWYGALFGARGVTKNLIEDLEYLDDMWSLSESLYKIAK